MKRIILALSIIVITSCTDNKSIDLTHTYKVTSISSGEDGLSLYYAEEHKVGVPGIESMVVFKDSTGRYKIHDNIPFLPAIEYPHKCDSIVDTFWKTKNGEYKYLVGRNKFSDGSPGDYKIIYKVTICGDTVSEDWKYLSKAAAEKDGCFTKDCY